MPRKKIWDNCMLIGEVPRTEGGKFKIELVARDGVKYVNIRLWYKRKTDNEWKPSATGISIPIAIPIGMEVKRPAAEMLELIKECLEKAEDFPLEDENNAVWWDGNND